MRRAAPLVLFLLLLALPHAASAQEAEASVVVVKVDGSIDRTVVGYLTDAIERAEADGATVILQLDSAGTLDQDAVDLAERIHEAEVPVVAWVGPAPAKAQGAGLLLVAAASLGAVAPGAGMGPLTPLDLAGADEPRPEDAERLARGWMVERDRADAAFPDAAIPAQPAVNAGLVEVVAPSVTDLLAELDGLDVTTASGAVTLRTEIGRAEGDALVEVRFVDLGPVDRVLHAAASPTWIYVLLVLGLAGLAFEITQPGFGFAGFSGIGMLALAMYGLVVVPFSRLGLVLLVGGIAAMTLDVVVRKLGAATVGGVVAFTAGSALVFGGVRDQIDVSPWLIGGTVLAAVLYWGFGLTVAVQSRERISSTQKGLVGLVGETRGELHPEGPVYVKGTLWRGRSADGPIPSGTRVRVRAVDGLILRVEPAPAPPPDDAGD